MQVQIGLADRVLHLEFSSSERHKYRHNYAKLALLIGASLFWYATSESRAADLLIADRLAYSVYRYSDTGTLLNTVIDHSLDIYQATGIAISPDSKKLYVSSSALKHVMKYDYNAATGTVSNPTIFADASDGLNFPNDLRFSPDGSIMYVADLSSSNGGVARFNVADGSSAGPKLLLSTPDVSGPFEAASMNFFKGQLVVGVFQDPTDTGGGIAISDFSVSTFPQYLVQPGTIINGATGLMIHDGYLYVAGLYSSQIRRFQLCDGQSNSSCNEQLNGQMDSTWGITGVPFPQDLVETPDGTGFLAGILGNSPGAGKISRYAFDGTLLSTFALPGSGGFTEATSLAFVPTALIGDFNGDHVVDAADYVVWRKASPNATLPNDDTPGVVDVSDYQDWRANFGKSAPASGAALGAGSVPEPAGVLLLFIAILAGSMVRKRT